MLDGKEPPSTTFCIPQGTPDLKMSVFGDPVGMYVYCISYMQNFDKENIKII